MPMVKVVKKHPFAIIIYDARTASASTFKENPKVVNKRSIKQKVWAIFQVCSQEKDEVRTGEEWAKAAKVEKWWMWILHQIGLNTW